MITKAPHLEPALLARHLIGGFLVVLVAVACTGGTAHRQSVRIHDRNDAQVMVCNRSRALTSCHAIEATAYREAMRRVQPHRSADLSALKESYGRMRARDAAGRATSATFSAKSWDLRRFEGTGACDFSVRY